MSAKAKYEIIEINSIDVPVDVSLLTKLEELHFNATVIASQFGKLPKDWLKTDQAKEYVNIISQKENIPFENLVRTTQGGRYKGTWLHNRLALAFARWCSAEFEYELDRWIECRIKDEHQRKLHRRELKTGYLPLTDAVQAAHEKDESHNYSNEANLINRLVTGMTAKKFKVTYNVKNVRDALTAAQAQLMNKVQRHNSVLIEMGVDYHERKRLLQQLVDRAA